MSKYRLTLAGMAVVLILLVLAVIGLGPGKSGERGLRAGFAAVRITPPPGTRLSGFGDRDFRPDGAKGVHDDLFVRTLYLSQEKTEVLIMGFDILFFSRDEADRFKGAIGARLGLPPANILLNTSHTHTGPKVGNWYYTPSDYLYLDELEKRTVEAAVEAKKNAAAATLRAGETRTSVPLSRRLMDSQGTLQFAPSPAGAKYDFLPFVLFEAQDGRPVCLLFSVSCHASTIKGDERADYISADFPGAAAGELDRNLGRPCALFLQGAGGDAKASVIGLGLKEWRAGTWEDVGRTGTTIASEILAAKAAGLKEIKPALAAGLFEMELPLGPAPGRDELLRVVEEVKAKGPDVPSGDKARGLWAEEQLNLIDRGFGLASAAPVLVQGIALGLGLRLVAVEGELTADLGHLIRDYYGGGLTFPLGYSNGARMYLPSSRMIDEGGYEVESYWEYRQPAPLLKGVETHYTRALDALKKAGIQ
jgi:neutral ceramidase